jgi:plasmid maintenance system killer protein
MTIEYSNNKLEKQLNNATETKRAFGKMAAKILQRMDEIRSFDNLHLLMQLPAAKCHALIGDRQGEWAVSISGNHRMIFVIINDPVPLMEDGGIDTGKINTIKIIGTEDYH